MANGMEGLLQNPRRLGDCGGSNGHLVLLTAIAAQQISTCPSPCACASLERRQDKPELNRSAKRWKASEFVTA